MFKSIILAVVLMAANISFVQASEEAIGRDKNVIICYIGGVTDNTDLKFVYYNTKSIWYTDGGTTVIDFNNGGRIVFSGAYSCIQSKSNNELVDRINRFYGTRQEHIPKLDR